MSYIDTTISSFPTFHQKETNDYMKGWNACLKSVLQQTPSVDVEEVCRCAECKFSKVSYGDLHCAYPYHIVSECVKPTHFCSSGERRTDDDL